MEVYVIEGYVMEGETSEGETSGARSKSTSLSSGFSDVIKAARYDLLIHCLIS